MALRRGCSAVEITNRWSIHQGLKADQHQHRPHAQRFDGIDNPQGI